MISLALFSSRKRLSKVLIYPFADWKTRAILNESADSEFLQRWVVEVNPNRSGAKGALSKLICPDELGPWLPHIFYRPGALLGGALEGIVDTNLQKI